MAAKAGVPCKHAELMDEYTAEVREEIAEDVRLLAEEAIAWAGRFYNIPCPHLGQGKIGKDWYAIH